MQPRHEPAYSLNALGMIPPLSLVVVGETRVAFFSFEHPAMVNTNALGFLPESEVLISRSQHSQNYY